MRSGNDAVAMDDIQETMKIEQGQLIVCRSQDVSKYLDRNRRECNDFQARRNTTRRKVAEIPLIVVEKWLKMGVNIFDKNDNRKVQQLLNSNEYAYLRTSPGKCRVR